MSSLKNENGKPKSSNGQSLAHSSEASTAKPLSLLPPPESSTMRQSAAHTERKTNAQRDQNSAPSPFNPVASSISSLQPPGWTNAEDDPDETNTFSWVLTGSDISTDGSWALISRNQAIEEEFDRTESPQPVSEAWRLSLDVAGAFGTPVPKEWTADQEDLEFPPDRNFLASGAEAEASNTREKKRKAKRGDERSKEMMRQFGGCVRCRANNLRCDFGTPCKVCIAVTEDPTQFFGPCYREELTSVKLARHGNGNFGQRDVTFVNYPFVNDNAASKTLTIRWSLPDGRPVDLPFLGMTCKEFVPRSEDTHHITWNVGDQVMTVKLPPYAGDEPKRLCETVNSFLDKGIGNILSYIIDATEFNLSAMTLREAIRWSKEHGSESVDLALRIRCASFCSQGWGSLVGSETLGIEVVDFNAKGTSGYAAYDRGFDIPLPLSIDHQFDVALLLTIKEYQDRVLKLLPKMIFRPEGCRPPWYEIFLTFFVLVSNLEYVHGGSLSFYLAQKNTGNASTCCSLTQEMIEEFIYSAENLLHHFTAILHANNGLRVAMKNMEEVRDREGLDEPAVKYMKDILDILTRSDMTPRYRGPTFTTEDDLPAPDGRWIMRLFDGVSK